MAQPDPSLPRPQGATKNSTVNWQENLELLFHHEKDRFPDVVWELAGEEVSGHKGTLRTLFLRRLTVRSDRIRSRAAIVSESVFCTVK